jgi:deoxyribodipyrimidine photo-lyase
MTTAFWFNRDHRLQDNVALKSAVDSAIHNGSKRVVAVSVIDESEFRELAGIRQHSLVESLRALDQSLSGGLNVLRVANGNVYADSFAEILASMGVSRVFGTRAFDPSTVRLQKRVGEALAARGVDLFLLDSYYAVQPGSVRKPDGTPYRVYTPFFKNWLQLGWDAPVSLDPSSVEWLKLELNPSNRVDATSISAKLGLPEPSKDAAFPVRAGEAFALETFEKFRDRALDKYDDLRNRADLSGTSHLSHALAFGEVHPRTLLRELSDSSAHTVFMKEIAWREFYADVLWHNPTSQTDYLEPRFASMRYDTGELADARLEAWKQGKTGYPMVDAGMRQLLQTGWMHNRVRMIVASFLVKDLHLEWQQGAEWFERNLSDFDPASNSHGWQWTAGCGTDASPYYRVFNPVLQGLKFDPDGNYVRKYVAELAHVPGPSVHEPWLLPEILVPNYPSRIVDHATERDESLARLKEIKA